MDMDHDETSAYLRWLTATKRRQDHLETRLGHVVNPLMMFSIKDDAEPGPIDPLAIRRAMGRRADALIVDVLREP